MQYRYFLSMVMSITSISMQAMDKNIARPAMRKAHSYPSLRPEFSTTFIMAPAIANHAEVLESKMRIMRTIASGMAQCEKHLESIAFAKNQAEIVEHIKHIRSILELMKLSLRTNHKNPVTPNSEQEDT